jgi:hypothetical protein
MIQQNAYPVIANQPIVSIIKGVDQDVERCEDILMLGYGFVLMSPLFAPILPPHILLPLMAFAFIVSVCVTRFNFHTIQKKLNVSISLLSIHDAPLFKPLVELFAEYPKHSLTDSFNPLKNILRTVKSTLGSLLINPLWMPIFYMLGLQFAEEKQIQMLNKTVIMLEQKTADWQAVNQAAD